MIGTIASLSDSLAYLLPNKYCSVLSLCSLNLTRLLTFLVIAFYYYYYLSLLLFTTVSSCYLLISLTLQYLTTAFRLLLFTTASRFKTRSPLA